MRKIADPTELSMELERLLSYTSSKQPSRVRLASELRELSVRVAGGSLGQHFSISLKEIASGRGLSASQSLAQLDDSV